MRIKKNQNRRCSSKMDNMGKMLEYLEVKLLLNPTAIMRLGLATLYKQEKAKEGVNYE